MRKINRSLCVLSALVLIAGCAAMQSTTQHQDIETGIRMTEAHMSIQHEYTAMWRVADEDQRAWMDANIAPLIDQSRRMIVAYNEAVLANEPSPYAEHEIRWMFGDILDKMEKVMHD